MAKVLFPVITNKYKERTFGSGPPARLAIGWGDYAKRITD